MEEQEAIFEKSYQVGSTTKGVREGTGLGLPISRHIVEQQGGRIWLESEPGQGSRFSSHCLSLEGQSTICRAGDRHPALPPEAFAHALAHSLGDTRLAMEGFAKKRSLIGNVKLHSPTNRVN